MRIEKVKKYNEAYKNYIVQEVDIMNGTLKEREEFLSNSINKINERIDNLEGFTLKNDKLIYNFEDEIYGINKKIYR